jgi:hypothetical protein
MLIVFKFKRQQNYVFTLKLCLGRGRMAGRFVKYAFVFKRFSLFIPMYCLVNSAGGSSWFGYCVGKGGGACPDDVDCFRH